MLPPVDEFVIVIGALTHAESGRLNLGFIAITLHVVEVVSVTIFELPRQLIELIFPCCELSILYNKLFPPCAGAVKEILVLSEFDKSLQVAPSNNTHTDTSREVITAIMGARSEESGL